MGELTDASLGNAPYRKVAVPIRQAAIELMSEDIRPFEPVEGTLTEKIFLLLQEELCCI